MPTQKKQIRLMLPQDVSDRLRDHIKNVGLTFGKFVNLAFREFLDMYEGLSEQEQWQFRRRSLLASLNEQDHALRSSVPTEIKERLDAIASMDGARRTIADVYWTAVYRLLVKEKVLENASETQKNVTVFSLDFFEEQALLVRQLIAARMFRSDSDFLLQSLERWLDTRAGRGSARRFEYLSRPRAEKGSSLETLHVSIPPELRNRVAGWANADGQSIKNVIYNAAIELMDVLIEEIEAQVPQTREERVIARLQAMTIQRIRYPGGFVEQSSSAGSRD